MRAAGCWCTGRGSQQDCLYQPFSRCRVNYKHNVVVQGEGPWAVRGGGGGFGVGVGGEVGNAVRAVGVGVGAMRAAG